MFFILTMIHLLILLTILAVLFRILNAVRDIQNRISTVIEKPNRVRQAYEQYLNEKKE
ncbi:hypothetical protein [Rossellomorea aquimaris]|uniref:hypothetical protein n=1 Tax=Rossellomorea aquimaris TaxID=189382 RepID=UPI000AFE1342|nr:hypothetical protein [Rossellomorea aquimaris]